MQITFPGPDIYLQSKVFPVSTMTTLLNAAKIQKFEVKQIHLVCMNQIRNQIDYNWESISL